MTILAVGYTPNDYTGWGGVGSPVYSSVNGTWTAGNSSAFVQLQYGLTVAHGQVGCLWLPFAKSVNTFSITADIAFYGGGTGYCPVIIHTAAMNAWLVLSYDVATSVGQNWPFYWYLAPNLSDVSTWTKISPFFVNGYSGTQFLYCVEVEGAGTANGVIRFYNDSNVYVGTLIGTWTGDLTNYKDFNAVSFHAPSITSSYDSHFEVTNLYGCVVSDKRLRGAWMLHYMYDSDAGTYSEWAGSAAYFATVPSVYSSYGSGYYASTVGARLTFGVENSEIPNKTGFQIYEVRTVANIRGGYDSPTAVAPYLYDTVGKTGVTGDAVTMNPDGQSVTYSYPVNPVSGVTWTSADLKQYEFGLIRTA